MRPQYPISVKLTLSQWRTVESCLQDKHMRMVDLYTRGLNYPVEFDEEVMRIVKQNIADIERLLKEISSCSSKDCSSIDEIYEVLFYRDDFDLFMWHLHDSYSNVSSVFRYFDSFNTDEKRREHETLREEIDNIITGRLVYEVGE